MKSCVAVLLKTVRLLSVDIWEYTVQLLGLGLRRLSTDLGLGLAARFLGAGRTLPEG